MPMMLLVNAGKLSEKRVAIVIQQDSSAVPSPKCICFNKETANRAERIF